MKRFAPLFLIATPAFGHLVPYDSKAFLELAKGSPEKAGYIAHFCSLAADSGDECLERLIAAKGEDAAEKCGREIKEVSKETLQELHLIGGIPGKPETGHHHSIEIKTKEEGNHKSGYSTGERQVAAMLFGTTYIEAARKQAEKINEFRKESVENTSFLEGLGKLIAGKLGVSFETEIKGGGSHKESSETSTTKGSLTKFEIAVAYNEGYRLGWADPSRAGVEPNIYCSDKIKGCSATDGGKYSMSDDFTVIPPIPKDHFKDEGPLTKKTTPDENNTTASTADKPNTEKSAPKKSEWQLIQPSQSGDFSPVQACYEIEMTKIKKKEAVENVEGDDLNYTQRKLRAEENLAMGVCDDSFFGQDFCRDWKQKQKLHIDETLLNPSVALEEQAFEEFATIEESADSLKDPFAPLEGSDPFNPIPVESCVQDCPIEGQDF